MQLGKFSICFLNQVRRLSLLSIVCRQHIPQSSAQMASEKVYLILNKIMCYSSLILILNYNFHCCAVCKHDYANFTWDARLFFSVEKWLVDFQNWSLVCCVLWSALKSNLNYYPPVHPKTNIKQHKVTSRWSFLFLYFYISNSLRTNSRKNNNNKWHFLSSISVVWCIIVV